jgi:hypothetical protein
MFRAKELLLVSMDRKPIYINGSFAGYADDDGTNVWLNNFTDTEAQRQIDILNKEVGELREQRSADSGPEKQMSKEAYQERDRRLRERFERQALSKPVYDHPAFAITRDMEIIETSLEQAIELWHKKKIMDYTEERSVIDEMKRNVKKTIEKEIAAKIKAKRAHFEDTAVRSAKADFKVSGRPYETWFDYLNKRLDKELAYIARKDADNKKDFTSLYMLSSKFFNPGGPPDAEPEAVTKEFVEGIKAKYEKKKINSVLPLKSRIAKYFRI